jgi:hypothetical protein
MSFGLSPFSSPPFPPSPFSSPPLSALSLLLASPFRPLLTYPPTARALRRARTMPKSSRCLSAVIARGIGSRMHAQFPSRPWRVGSDEEKVLTLMLKPESDLSAVPESGFGGPTTGPGPESPGRIRPCRAPICERPRPGTLTPTPLRHSPRLSAPFSRPPDCGVTCANPHFGPHQGPVSGSFRPPDPDAETHGQGGRIVAQLAGRG